MKGSHIVIRRIVVPFLTAVMVCGFTSNAFALDIPPLPENDGNITIEEVVDVNNKNENSTNSWGNTFSKIETLFGVTESPDGNKYGCLYRNKLEEYVSSPTLYTALSNSEVQKTFEGIKSDLEKFAGDIFNDMGKHWARPYVALPVYFNVLSGYEDETLRPDNNITCAEVAKVMASTFENDTDKGSKVWYAKYYNKVAKAFTYDNLDVNDEYFDKYMTRCEIAYVIANYVSGGNGYTADLSSLSAFADCGLIGADDDGTMSKDIEIINAGYIPSRYAKALAYLVDKGVFEGYEDEVTGVRTLNPTGEVKRSEVFTLLVKLCKATPSYNYGQFTGNINFEYIEDEQAPVQTQKPSKPSKPSHSSSEPQNELVNGGITSFEEWQSRGPITARYDDPTRPRLKVGDTFVADDGTSYYLEHSGIWCGDVEVAGVGLPIATDLGRQYTTSLGTTTIDHRYQPTSHTFGWINSNVSTCGREYIVFSTGEGHWDTEWAAIAEALRPTEPGYDGQVTDDGYFVYRASRNRWDFLPAHS